MYTFIEINRMKNTFFVLLSFAVILYSCKTTANTTNTSSTKDIPNGATPTVAYFTSTVLPILVEKCNGCHSGKSGHVPVFKEEHVKDKHIINEVYTTVFVEESMPKGKVKLTDEEKAILKYWVKTPFN